MLRLGSAARSAARRARRAHRATRRGLSDAAKEPILVIGGGVGPAAGVLLHQHIIACTEAPLGDRSHLGVLHVSRSARVADRTAYVMGLLGPDELVPQEGLFESVEAAVNAAHALGGRAIVGVPCNTFHAPRIWGEFEARVRAMRDDVVLLHLIDECVAAMRQAVPAGAKVGVVSTLGSMKVGVHADALRAAGFEVLQMTDVEAELATDAIMGLKEDTAHPQAIRQLRAIGHRMRSDGAELLLLGCTELPFAFPDDGMFEGIPTLDPMQALARAMVSSASP